MECRAYGICLDSQSRGYLGKDRKVSSAAGGNLSRMHKTQETAKESRLNFMYSHLRNRTLARLRRARLLAGEDPHNPGSVDTHPLVREYYGEQLRGQRSDAWKECNKRLFNYYRTLAPQLPDNFAEMEPLFLAVICGCNAGLFREALHEVYIPRIQRGDAHFAANVLGATGPLLSVLGQFFERGRWGSLIETAIEGERLTEEDHLFILMQAGLLIISKVLAL